MSDATDTQVLTAALQQALSNALIIAAQLDKVAQTDYASKIAQIMTPAAPPAPAPSSSPWTNGMSQPNAQGFVQLQAVEDYRSQCLSSGDPNKVRFANDPKYLPHWWAIQDVLTEPSFSLTDEQKTNIGDNCANARFLISIAGGDPFKSFYMAYWITKSTTGLYTLDQSKPIADTGAMGGDLVIGTDVRWTGVRVKDMPSVVVAMEAIAARYFGLSAGGVNFSPA